MRTIIVTISPQGKPTVKTEGYAGSSCKEASEFLEKALGQTVSETKTSEYFETNNINTNTVTTNQ